MTSMFVTAKLHELSVQGNNTKALQIAEVTQNADSVLLLNAA